MLMWSEAICADACWSVLLLCLIYMCGPDKTSTQGRCLFPHNEEQVMMGQREPRKGKKEWSEHQADRIKKLLN